MKLRFSLLVPLLLLAHGISAEEIFYRLEGVIIQTDDKDVGCSIEVGSEWEHCVGLDSDTEDMAPENSDIGRYPIDSGFAVAGTCRFHDLDATSSNEVVVTNDGGWGDTFEVFTQFTFDNDQEILWVHMFSWLYDTTANMFGSDALPLSPNAMDAANSNYVEISAYDLYNNWYGHVGIVNNYSISTVPCGGVEDLLTYLAAELIALNLHAGISNSLDVKLQAVFDMFTDLKGKKLKSAINHMEAFINEVEAQSGKHIPEEDADHLLDLAEAVLDKIS